MKKTLKIFFLFFSILQLTGCEFVDNTAKTLSSLNPSARKKKAKPIQSVSQSVSEIQFSNSLSLLPGESNSKIKFSYFKDKKIANCSEVQFQSRNQIVVSDQSLATEKVGSDCYLIVNREMNKSGVVSLIARDVLDQSFIKEFQVSIDSHHYELKLSVPNNIDVEIGRSLTLPVNILSPDDSSVLNDSNHKFCSQGLPPGAILQDFEVPKIVRFEDKQNYKKTVRRTQLKWTPRFSDLGKNFDAHLWVVQSNKDCLSDAEANSIVTLKVIRGNAEIVNLKQYGASGDGIYDDGLALQSALKYISDTNLQDPNKRFIMLFPQGKYKLCPVLPSEFEIHGNIIKLKESEEAKLYQKLFPTKSLSTSPELGSYYDLSLNEYHQWFGALQKLDVKMSNPWSFSSKNIAYMGETGNRNDVELKFFSHGCLPASDLDNLKLYVKKLTKTVSVQGVNRYLISTNTFESIPSGTQLRRGNGMIFQSKGSNIVLSSFSIDGTRYDPENGINRTGGKTSAWGTVNQQKIEWDIFHKATTFSGDTRDLDFENVDFKNWGGEVLYGAPLGVTFINSIIQNANSSAFNFTQGYVIDNSQIYNVGANCIELLAFTPNRLGDYQNSKYTEVIINKLTCHADRDGRSAALEAQKKELKTLYRGPEPAGEGNIALMFQALNTALLIENSDFAKAKLLIRHGISNTLIRKNIFKGRNTIQMDPWGELAYQIKSEDVRFYNFTFEENVVDTLEESGTFLSLNGSTNSFDGQKKIIDGMLFTKNKFFVHQSYILIHQMFVGQLNFSFTNNIIAQKEGPASQQPEIFRTSLAPYFEEVNTFISPPSSTGFSLTNKKIMSAKSFVPNSRVVGFVNTLGNFHGTYSRDEYFKPVLSDSVSTFERKSIYTDYMNIDWLQFRRNFASPFVDNIATPLIKADSIFPNARTCSPIDFPIELRFNYPIQIYNPGDTISINFTAGFANSYCTSLRFPKFPELPHSGMNIKIDTTHHLDFDFGSLADHATGVFSPKACTYVFEIKDDPLSLGRNKAFLLEDLIKCWKFENGKWILAL